MHRIPVVSAAVLLLLSWPASAAPAASTKQKIALLGVNGGVGSSDLPISTIEELLLSALTATGRFEVTGRSDIGAILGLEAQKQALGCSDDTSCMAEIAGSLGVDLIAAADVGKLGEATIVTLKFIQAKTARALVRVKRKVVDTSKLDELLDGLARDAVAMLDGNGPAGTSPPPPGTPSRLWTWVALAATVVAAGAGGVMMMQANGLRASNVTGTDAGGVVTNSITEKQAESANFMQRGAMVGFGAAGLFAAGTVGLFLFELPAGAGGGVGVTGSF